MRYLPHTDDDVAAMLSAVGAARLQDLFVTVPQDCRRADDLDLPGPLTEWELTDRMTDLAGSMGVSPTYRVFAGAGSYEHFIPASIAHLLGRSEFSTSYTPYQPEISQGTLQAIYEYQTLAARLLGMDVANASLYDGGSALAEALLMAVRVTGRKRVAVSRSVNPLYRRVLATYLQSTGVDIVELPYETTGCTDLATLDDLGDIAAVAVQSPNFFGCIEDLRTIGEKVHNLEALLVTCFSEPLAYGLLKSPGSLGADIACGEAQSFGVPRSFGGPSLGMFATRMQYVRTMPGRLVGRTLDRDGKPGFVLTLATREQHIRREKATSNICTNHSLCALTAAMYLASLGGTGLRELAALNRDKAEYLKARLAEAGCKTAFTAATFNEFTVRVPDTFDTTYERLLDRNIVAGLPLARWYPELSGHYLLCVTEVISRDDMDALVREVRS
jgi:glycine dehydrogenase subunit 1